MTGRVCISRRWRDRTISRRLARARENRGRSAGAFFPRRVLRFNLPEVDVKRLNLRPIFPRGFTCLLASSSSLLHVDTVYERGMVSTTAFKIDSTGEGNRTKENATAPSTKQVLPVKREADYSWPKPIVSSTAIVIFCCSTSSDLYGGKSSRLKLGSLECQHCSRRRRQHL